MPPAPPSLTLEWFAEQFGDLRARMEILDRKVSGIQRKDQDMSEALTRIDASVDALVTTTQGLVTAAAANDTELAALANDLRNRTNPDDSDALNALADKIDAARGALAQATAAAASALTAATAPPAGDDTVSAPTGDDTVAAPTGDDTVAAPSGDDTVSGAAGDDTTSGA